MWLFGKKEKNLNGPFTEKASPAADAAPADTPCNRSLTIPVKQNDMGAVRDVLNRAFESRRTITPHWYHLFQAAENGNREMLRLLVQWGGEWTEQQRDILIPLMSATGADLAKYLIPHMNKPVALFEGESLQQLRLFMGKRIELEKKPADSDEVKSQYYHVMEGMRRALWRKEYDLMWHYVTCFAHDNVNHSVHIHALRHEYGVTPEFRFNFAKRLIDEGHAAFIEKRYFEKAFRPAEADYPSFDKAGMINHEWLPELRQEWIKDWTGHLEGTYDWFKNMAKEMYPLHSHFFTADANVTKEEADAFVDAHARNFGVSDKDPLKNFELMRCIDRQLLSCGYFGAKAFTEDHIYQLSRHGHVGGDIEQSFYDVMRAKKAEAAAPYQPASRQPAGKGGGSGRTGAIIKV